MLLDFYEKAGPVKISELTPNALIKGEDGHFYMKMPDKTGTARRDNMFMDMTTGKPFHYIGSPDAVFTLYKEVRNRE